VGDWFGDWFATFDRDAHFDVEETIDLDEDSVLLVANHHASGRKSGVEVSEQVVWLYRLRSGKIASVEGYESRAQALAALGHES
jgi:ketosteroid isomerase-like protein